MKKIFLIAAVAALVFTSCAKEHTGSNTGTKTLTVKVSSAQGSQSRAIQAPGQNEKVTLTSGEIYLFKPDGSLIEEINMNVAAINSTGQVISDVPSDARVFILGNATMSPTATKWSDIQLMLNTPRQNFYKDAVLSNSSGAPMAMTISTTEEGKATAKVELNPPFSRLELADIAGGVYEEEIGGVKTGEKSRITKFKVTGVAVNNMFEKYSYDGIGHDLFSMASAWAPAVSFFDENASGWESTGTWGTPTDAPKVELPSAGAPDTNGPAGYRYWGYEVPAGNLPQLVIRITGVEYEVLDKTAGTWGAPSEPQYSTDDVIYVVVKGYTTTAAPTGISEFTRGEIYQINPGSLTFNIADIHTTPDYNDDVKLTVKVEVQAWTVEELNANVQ